MPLNKKQANAAQAWLEASDRQLIVPRINPRGSRYHSYATAAKQIDHLHGAPAASSDDFLYSGLSSCVPWFGPRLLYIQRSFNISFRNCCIEPGTNRCVSKWSQRNEQIADLYWKPLHISRTDSLTMPGISLGSTSGWSVSCTRAFSAQLGCFSNSLKIMFSSSRRSLRVLLTSDGLVGVGFLFSCPAQI